MDDRRNNVDQRSAKTSDKSVTPEHSESDRQRALWQALLISALDLSDPLQSGVRASGAQLMEIGQKLGEGILNKLNQSSTDFTKELIDVIDSLTLLERQASRFVELDRKIGSEKQKGPY